MLVLCLLCVVNLVVVLCFVMMFLVFMLIVVYVQLVFMLVIGLLGDIILFDLYFYNVMFNLNVVEYMFEVLIVKDEKMCFKLGFVMLWKVLSDMVWEVKLCFGVYFYDGSEFILVDVVYLLVCLVIIKNSLLLFMIYMCGFKEVMVVDKLIVCIIMNGLYLLVLNDLLIIYMVLKKVVEKVGVDDFNNGCVMIGIGLYKFVFFNCGDCVEFMCFDGYWGKKL